MSATDQQDSPFTHDQQSAIDNAVDRTESSAAMFVLRHVRDTGYMPTLVDYERSAGTGYDAAFHEGSGEARRKLQLLGFVEPRSSAEQFVPDPRVWTSTTEDVLSM